MIFSRRISQERRLERGNVLVVSFLLVTLLTALATAHFATVQKNTRQSNFVNGLGDLRRYAETGVRLAMHELTYDLGGGDGNIGTELWTAAADVGRDGTGNTSDEGEADGIPTPGEPNLMASTIGPAAQGMGLLVRTTDSAWPNVKRVVSTAFNQTAIATVEVYVEEMAQSVPGVGAAYVEPGVVLDLKGNSFLIDGHDTNPNGTPGPGAPVNGISTTVGSPPGSNTTNLLTQIPGGREDQIIGLGSTPSVGETNGADFNKIFNAFKAVRDNIVTPGTYSDAAWGDYATNSYQVTYCEGDLHLSGTGKGAGVLIVDGSLTMSGKFDFVGVVIVRGDTRLTGGGSGVHIWGSLMIGQSLTAVDPDPDLGVMGNAKVFYSSVGLAKASGLLGSSYKALYWHDLK